MNAAVAILGGSTPFTAALVEAIRASDLPPFELRLFGQDTAALERMRRYGAARLRERGFTVRASARLDEAAAGAAAVVNQIRFGGLAGRGADEDVANRFQLPADETLGPFGLSAALRVVPRIRELAAELGARCPDAWVLNLANPLSLTTAAMIDAGAPRKCFGLCELPVATVAETCRLLSRPVSEVSFRYAGLNHRGFIWSMQHRGEELVPRLPELLGTKTVFGIGADDIKRVGALPLKYFRLALAAPRPAAVNRRAGVLTALREEIAREIDAGAVPPPSLSRRDLRWYADAVVPMLAAIFSETPHQVVLNCKGSDGLVHELRALVSRHGVEELPCDPPPAVRGFIDRFAAHERALLRALEAPSQDRIEEALDLDPVVPKAQLREIARAMSAQHVN